MCQFSEHWYVFVWPNLAIITILIIKKAKFIYLILLIYLIVGLLSFNFTKTELRGHYSIECTVYKTTENYFLINWNGEKIIVFNTPSITRQNIREFSKIIIDGEIEKFHFDTKLINWVKEHNIKYKLTNPSLRSIIHPEFSLSHYIRHTKFVQLGYFNAYWGKLLFGLNNSSNQMINDHFKNLSISHMVVVSGFHIDVLMIIAFLFKFKNKKIDVLYKSFIFVVIWFYLCLLINPISGLRAFFMKIFILLWTRKKRKRVLEAYDSLIYSMTIIFLLNPKWVLSISFLLTTINSFYLNFLTRQFKKLKVLQNSIIRFILTIFAISMINVLTSLILNKSFNFSSLFIVILIAPIIQILYLFSLIFWWSPEFLNFLFFILHQIIHLFTKINSMIKIDYQINYIWLYVYPLMLFPVLNLFFYFLKTKINNKKPHFRVV